MCLYQAVRLSDPWSSEGPVPFSSQEDARNYVVPGSGYVLQYTYFLMGFKGAPWLHGGAKLTGWFSQTVYFCVFLVLQSWLCINQLQTEV